MDKKKFYLTTAITYTSGKPHVGNTYEIVLADAIARAKRLEGYDVVFQTGTDEHGEKIELKAAEKGTTPKQFVDDVAGEIERIWRLMNTSFDRFVRTTDAYHEEQVQKIFRKLYEQGDIYKGTYKGWYCTPCESFWTESQLVDGKCPDCGREVKMAEEEAYFFRMSKYADALMKYFDEHPDFITPVSRKNEMINNFLKPGLQDLCVSRTSFRWGIPVDFDSRHVVYVWLDALTNYITGAGFRMGENNAEFGEQWPADLHVIGKDIVRFHVIYWPIFLMALGLPLPKQVYGHPWLLQNGGKMSKSKGNVIYADDMAKVFGVDATRYCMLSQMPFENDGVISWKMAVDIINSELVNVYGNLVQRTVAMANKYFGGVVGLGEGEENVDLELLKQIRGLRDKAFADMDEYRAADALEDIFAALRRANKYIDETAPWVLAKDESKKDRLQRVLHNLIEAIVVCSSALYPFMPETAAKAVKLCGCELLDFDALAAPNIGVVKTEENAQYLFVRLDPEKVKAELLKQKIIPDESAFDPQEEKIPAKEEKKGKQDKNPPREEKPENTLQPSEIGIDEFAKVQLRVGTILAAEKVEKADKLLKLAVKIGDETRTIVSGIAKYYKPEEIVGKRVIVVTNLKAAKLRGIESQGMLLCACYLNDDGSEEVTLITPENRVPDGATVR